MYFPKRSMWIFQCLPIMLGIQKGGSHFFIRRGAQGRRQPQIYCQSIQVYCLQSHQNSKSLLKQLKWKVNLLPSNLDLLFAELIILPCHPILPPSMARWANFTARRFNFTARHRPAIWFYRLASPGDFRQHICTSPIERYILRPPISFFCK